MRRLLPFLFLASAIGACRCGPPDPVSVTLRVKNSSGDPIYVDQTGGVLGLEIQRSVAGTWTSFSEKLPCACLACDQVCNGCACDAGTGDPLIVKIPAGTSQERTWTGVVAVSATASCGSLVGGSACLREENAPVDEQFRLHFCYALSAPAAQTADGGVPVPGTLRPDSLLCTERTFQIEEGEVEVSPVRGASCSEHSDCSASASDGGVALCFDGTCTPACPQNDFTPVGGAWQVSVTEPDNAGFFNLTQTGTRKVWVGTGTVTSVRYDSNTMSARLSNAAGIGGFQVALPAGSAIPLTAGPTSGTNKGETVTVQIIEVNANTANRAMTLRDAAGKLLLAADSAQGGAILGASDTSPFAISNPKEIVGCNFDSCGKRLHYATHFAGGDPIVDLEPSETALVTAAGATFRLLSVGNNGFSGGTNCTLKSQVPYVIGNPRSTP